MKKAVFVLILAIIACIAVNLRSRDTAIRTGTRYDNRNVRITEGKIKKGDTLFKILRKNMIDQAELDDIRVAADGVYDLGKLCSGRPYRIAVDDGGRLDSLVYWADDDTYLNISREGDSLNASMENVDYTRGLIALGGTVRDNLISSLGPCKDALGLALDLSDIFAWDIDFNTDLRNGDTYRIVVEGLFLDNTLKKFGPIVSAELVNNGRTYTAYRFTKNGITRYYDSSGMPLKKKFLKAPLNFRRISSYWTKRRFHPVLKRYRPHRGVDYVAQRGTPVSAIGSGSVHFAGYRAGYGKLVVIDHKHKRSTYYGHLSRVGKNIRQGVSVKQGDIIGCVGSTGLATGPHLHFEMRINGMPVNPLAENILPPDRVEAQYGADFKKFVRQMNERLDEAPIGEDPPLKTAFTPGRPGGL